jgi:hypothetical protein
MFLWLYVEKYKVMLTLLGFIVGCFVTVAVIGGAVAVKPFSWTVWKYLNSEYIYSI